MSQVKASKYELIRGDSADVEKKVNQLLEQGWELYGGPFVVPSTINAKQQLIIQPMIRLSVEST